VPVAVCDGIATRYEVAGSGPPLLLFSPGGFNGQLENWRTFGIYQRLQLVEHLSQSFTCITFDKRESGASGGRIERISWDDYAVQGVDLLDHLEVERAHLLGGCIGCSIAVNAAFDHPERVLSLVLYSPAGGGAYLATQRGRFAEHVAYVDEVGLGGVVELAQATDATFAQDPRVGPWVSVLRLDAAFAEEYASQNVHDYKTIVRETATTLFDRDSVPGAPADVLAEIEFPALVVPGNDANHATTAAQYLAECLPTAEYWDVMPEEQTSENAPQRIAQFLSSVSPASSA
jgi:pimeloyl-ACP methyl ester carboxylesterase